jgi:hypothetical protein
MLKKKRSRRMPALLITTSSRPKASTAALTILFADSHWATLSVFATALAPEAWIVGDFLRQPRVAYFTLDGVPMSFTDRGAGGPIASASRAGCRRPPR